MIHSFYTNFNVSSASLLTLRLADDVCFNQEHTQIEFVTPRHELLVRHHLGGKLNFDKVSHIELPLTGIKRKYKGWIQTFIYSTICKEKFIILIDSNSVEKQELILFE